MKIPREIIEVIRKHSLFLITSHIRPDGDAVGSLLALDQMLKKLGKRRVIQNESSIPPNFSFLPGAEKIRPYGELPFLPEVALILDSPSPERLGEVKKHLSRIPVLVNIDHHVSNEGFAQINWVEGKSSSVGEMIFHLLPHLGLKLTRPLALCLYVALLTDMGKFQFMVTPAAGVRVLNLAAELVKTGLVPYEIYKRVYNIYSPDQIRLLAEVLRHIRFASDNQIAYLTVTRDMLKRYGKTEDTNDDLIAYPRDISSTRVAMLFTEKEGSIKVSFRSKEPGLIDVNLIAAQFGGGGHRAAAGADIPGELKTVRSKILRAVEKKLDCLK